MRKVTDRFGTTLYYNDQEQLHREDGPAVVWSWGTKEWYVNDQLHREDGPAVEYTDGTKEWYVNGQRHRTDGPAIEWADGDKWWYVNGKELTEQEFNEQVKKDNTHKMKITITKIEDFGHKKIIHFSGESIHARLEVMEDSQLFNLSANQKVDIEINA